MSQLFGMWYGSAFPTYHGLQIMSVLMFFSFRTEALYDFAVTGPLTLRRAIVENLPAMKPICAKAWGSIFVYFLSTSSISRVSGPCEGSSRPNSELM